jgi:hypothetical protein
MGSPIAKLPTELSGISAAKRKHPIPVFGGENHETLQ